MSDCFKAKNVVNVETSIFTPILSGIQNQSRGFFLIPKKVNSESCQKKLSFINQHRD